MRPRPGRSPRSPIAVLSAAVLLVVVLAACSGAGPTAEPSGGSSPSQAATSASPAVSAEPASSSPEPSPSAPPSSPVVGVVIDVKSAGLTKVESFTIRTDAGETLTFQVGTLAPDSFPPGHLTEHAATGEPVQVTFQVDGDALVATDLGDAP
jgi:hypothetical protein